MKARKHIRLIALTLTGIAFGLCAGEQTSDPEKNQPSETQIKKWVAELGSEDFSLREEAEAALKKAGSKAIPIVQAALEAGDEEVKLRGQRVLSELRWAILEDIKDIPNALPQDTIMLLQTPALKASVANLRAKTAAGKFYDGEAFAKLRTVIGRYWVESTNLSPQDEETILTWQDEYGGPTGLSLLSFDTTNQWPREQMAIFIGLNGADQTKADKAFTQKFPIRTWGDANVLSGRYRGIPYTYCAGTYAQDARARIKNLIVCTTSEPSMKTVIDNIATTPPTPLSKASTFMEGMEKVGADAPISFYFSWDNFEKKAGHTLSQRDRAAFAGLGFEIWDYAAVSLKAEDDLIRERAFCRFKEGERKGLAKLLSLRATSGKLAEICPQDACAFISLPFEGKELYETIIEMAALIDAGDTGRFKAVLEQLETASGVRLAEDLLAALKGEAAIWALRPTGQDPLQPPQLGAVFETGDAQGAIRFVEGLAKLLKAVAADNATLKTALFKDRACHWMEIAEQGKDIPYTLSWCADGNRVLATGRQEDLQTLIKRIDAKAEGLADTADYKRLIQRVTPEERGGLIYVNTERALAWGYAIGLPSVGNMASEETRNKLKEAPQDVAPLLKDFPGTLFALAGAREGLRATSVGGIPTSGYVIAMPIAFFLQYRIIRMERRMKAVNAKAAVKVQEEKKAEE